MRGEMRKNGSFYGGGVGSNMATFKCSQGHIIGEVRRINRISRLLLYSPTTEQPKLTAVITGNADVVCSVCGEFRHWQIEAVLMEKLTDHRHAVEILDGVSPYNT